MEDNEFYEKYMIFIAIIGSLFLYIEAFNIYKNKSTYNISPLAFSLVLFVSLNWAVYAYVLENIVIMISSVLAIIGSSIILFLFWIYRNNSIQQ